MTASPPIMAEETGDCSSGATIAGRDHGGSAIAPGCRSARRGGASAGVKGAVAHKLRADVFAATQGRVERRWVRTKVSPSTLERNPRGSAAQQPFSRAWRRSLALPVAPSGRASANAITSGILKRSMRWTPPGRTLALLP